MGVWLGSYETDRAKSKHETIPYQGRQFHDQGTMVALVATVDSGGSARKVVSDSHSGPGTSIIIPTEGIPTC